MDDQKEYDGLEEYLTNLLSEPYTFKRTLNSQRWEVYFQENINNYTFDIFIKDHKIKKVAHFSIGIGDLVEFDSKDAKLLAMFITEKFKKLRKKEAKK